MSYLRKIFDVKKTSSLSEKDFELLFNNYYSLLCKLILKIVKDKTLTEDIIQEVYIKLWEKKDSLKIDTSLKAYLYKAAINTAYNHLQKNKQYPSLHIEDNFDKKIEANDAISIIEAKELEAKINSTLLLLPDACREVFILSRWEELSYKEIAETLSISIKTVENQMGKALKIFREQLFKK